MGTCSLGMLRALVVVCFCVEASAFGQTNSQWSGPTGTGGNGNWSPAGDWSPATVPNNSGPNTYNVTISNGTTTETITLDISPTINNLTVGSDATLQSQGNNSLTIASGGFLSNAGTLTFSTSGSSLKVNGSTTNTGAMNIEGGSTASLTGNVNNSGMFITGFSGGNNTVNVTGAFTNNSGATLSLEGSGDVANINTLSNSGKLSIGSGATLNLTGGGLGITDVVGGSTINQDGTLNVINGGTPTNGLANLTSVEGTLNLNNGAATAVTPSGGTLTISSSGNLNLSDGFASTTPTTLSITGNVNNSGSFTTGFSGGTNTVNVNGTFTNNAGASLRVGHAGDVANLNALSNSGIVTVGNGATLNLTGGGLGITDVVGGAAINQDGTLNVINGGTPSNGLANLTSVEGTLNLNNGATTVTPGGGTLTLSSSGAVNLSDGFASNTPTTLSITGNVNNSGSFTTGFSGGTNTVNVSKTFTNKAGAILTLGHTGDVANLNALSNSGTVTIGSGATLNLTGGGLGITDVVGGAAINQDGTLNVINGGTPTNGLANLTSVEGMLNLNNGTTTVTPSGGTVTISSSGSVNLSEGFAAATPTTLSITGNVNNSGSFTTGFSGGTNTVNVSKTFTNNTGATLSLDFPGDVANLNTLSNSGNATVGQGAMLVLTGGGTSTNSGLITLNGSTFEISAPSVTLAGSGTVTLCASNCTSSITTSPVITGAAGTDTLSSANTIQGTGNIGNGQMGFVNTGTVLANVSTPLIIDPSSTGFNNKGTLNVSTGDTLQITGPANSFLNYNSSTKTLTGGTYLVSGTLQFGPAGTSIVTNAANITLTGASSQIIDFNNEDVLANFATNVAASSFTIMGGRNFTTAGNFTNNGALTVYPGSKFKVNGNLANFSGTTLTGGIYGVGGTLQFNGANIVTNSANIILATGSSRIVDQNNANGLANFAVNNGKFTIQNGRNFTTAGNFANNGTLTVAAVSKFAVNGSLTNFSGTTLTGGTYALGGSLQFNGANIVTNAANITLMSTTSQIVNQTGVNALTNFATNAATGSFTLAGSQSLITAGGSFSNAGSMTIVAGSTLTVGNGGNTSLPVNYTQTGGTTTVDGTLTSSTSTTAPTLNLSGGSLFGGGTLGYAVDDASGTLTPGDSATKPGKLAVSQSYTQNSAGILDISIGGGTAGTQYDQLNVTSTANLNGTLNLTLINGFVPTVGSTFDILNARSVAGTFSTVNGTSINPSEHFVVTYNGNDVILTVASAPATVGSVQASLLGPSYSAMKTGSTGFWRGGPGHSIFSRGFPTGTALGSALSRTSVDFSGRSTFTQAASVVRNWVASTNPTRPAYTMSRLPASPSAYPAYSDLAALRVAKPASVDAVAHQVAMRLNSTTALRVFRSSVPATGLPSYVHAKASRVASSRMGPVTAASHRNNLLGRNRLEYNFDLLSILGGPRHLLGSGSSQPGSVSATNFGYLMLSGTH